VSSKDSIPTSWAPGWFVEWSVAEFQWINTAGFQISLSLNCLYTSWQDLLEGGITHSNTVTQCYINSICLEFGRALKLPSVDTEIVDQVVKADGYKAPEIVAGQPYNGFLADVWSMWVAFTFDYSQLIIILTFWRPLLPYGYSYNACCARPGSAVICNFWHPGTLTLSHERQSARMSKIANDDQKHRHVFRAGLMVAEA